MKYIIIGNGTAGMSAAQAIRKNDEKGEITMISRSSHLHYYRPGLIDYLSGEKPVEKLVTFKEDFYEKNRIVSLLDTNIAEINSSESFVASDSGEKFYYDRLLYAAGARSWMLPLEGTDTKGVFTLRGITDADAILDYCNDKKKVVVIGGGLLGLETANSLSLRGMDVSVVEYAPFLLPRQLDRDGGKVLHDMLCARGISFCLDDSLASIESEKGAVKGVKLKSGKELGAELVIMSVGIIPEITLAEKAGIETDRGVIVDEHCETSVKNIYAAGDAAEFEGRVSGLWTASMEQGKIAGSNMSGTEVIYQGTVPSTTLKVSGISLYSSGEVSSDDASEIDINRGSDSYVKFLSKNGSPLGSVVISDKEAISLARKFMSGNAERDDVRDFIKKRKSRT